MWIQAWLSGKEEEAKFIARLKKLLDEKIFNTVLINNINEVQDKLKSGISPEKLTNEEYETLEIIAFLDGIQLYQRPSKYKSFLFDKNLSQIDIVSISKVIASNRLEKLGNIQKIFSEPVVCNETELLTYINNLRHIIANEHDRVALSISSGQHRFGLRYDTESEQWIMVDQSIVGQNIEALTFSSSELIPFIKGVFATHENIIFNVDIFSATNNLPSSLLIEQLEQFRNQHFNEFDEEKATRETSYTKMTIAHIAALYGHCDYLQKYLDFKLPLTQCTNEKLTPAHFAAKGNQLEAMDILLQSPIDINAIAKDQSTPASIATEDGFFEMLRKLIDNGATNFHAPEDKSILDLALENDRKEMLLIILAAMPPQDLTKTQIKKIHKHRQELLVHCVTFAATLTADAQARYLEDIRDSNNALGFIFNHHQPTKNPIKFFQKFSKTKEMVELAKNFESMLLKPRLPL
ncbi:ankyrin repeat domain-containing protein [Legionella hackeliae]|nr:ankyrin repeat domain-containing protein [Legionella hackeliae]